MAKRTVVLVRQAGFGQVAPGDEAFGVQMLDSFLHVCEAPDARPAAIAFVTEGVRMACRGSPVLLALKILAEHGVEIVACKTCLGHYGLADALAVGRVGTMPEIVRMLQGADVALTV
jgi:hypothetical protein